MIPDVVRKFGLEYCDLPTMLWNVGTAMRLLSINIDRRYKPIPTIIPIWVFVTGFCYFYMYGFCMIRYSLFYAPAMGDILGALNAFSLGVASGISTSKLLFMYGYGDTIKNITDGYMACEAKVTPSSRFARNIRKKLRDVKKRALVFSSVIITNGVLYVMQPFVTPEKYKEVRFYEINVTSPVLEINSFCNVLAVYFTCALPSIITSFFIVVTGYTEAQMLALSYEITHLWTDAVEACNTNRDMDALTDAVEDCEEVIDARNKLTDVELKSINAYIKTHLKNMVTVHIDNINLIKQVEHVFRGAIASEFSLLIVALIAELVVGLETTWIQMPYALFQVGADCLIGQRIIDASIVFEKAVYDSKWENFDVANRKTVLLMLNNAQKTMTLSAGSVTTLSFMSFMAVIKSIYSAYTALRSTVH